MQRKGSLIQKLVICYLILWTISPPLGIDMKYRLLALGSVGIWGIIALGNKYYVEKIHVYAVAFAIMVAVIAYVEKGSLDGILQQIALYMLVICFVINAYYQEGHWHELSIIVPIILIFLIIFNYKTSQMLLADPGIARKIVRADEQTFMYMRQGVGGYGLIYPQVCVFPAIVAWVKSAFRKNKVCCLIGCVWIYSFVSCLFSAGYSIAIYTSAIGVIILSFYKGKNSIRALTITVVIFAGVLGALVYLEEFRSFMLTTFEGTEIVTKINDLLSTSESGAAEGSIYARVKAYSASVEAIVRYPIIGGLWNTSGGGHSAILDAIAKYGILGGFLCVKMLFYVPNEYKKRIDNPWIHRISNAVTISMLYVLLLNSAPFNFMAMLLLVLPILYEDIIRWENISNESVMDS